VYGVRGAVAAGMSAFGFGGGLTPAFRLVEAGAKVFDAMTDLAPMLIGQHDSAPRHARGERRRRSVAEVGEDRGQVG
jgi:hypothetical protein